ncbi:MAG: ribonuclease HIII [Planctomycetota bacterium]|nr:MAG: ribonuclease HIII [Planctomycetota bacterium]
MTAPASITVPFDHRRIGRLRQALEALGYQSVPPPPHARLQAAGDRVRITLYDSGKLLLQGKRAAEVREELRALGALAPGMPAAGHASAARPAAGGPSAPAATAGANTAAGAATATVGSDECGKGDVFGPLVVAAVRLEAESAARLQELGLADSKRLAPARIETLAAEIARDCVHEVVAITPARYNALYARMRNLNRLLAWAHGRAIMRVLERSGPARVVVDRFAADERLVREALGPLPAGTALEQYPRAEEREPAVAAASVLARARFVEALEQLSQRAGLVLPPGAAAHVEQAARELVRRHGAQALPHYAKMHFRSIARVLGGG